MKARLPEGYGGGAANMMKQIQKMQEDMQKYQEDLETREFTVSAGGGAVSATMTGKKQLLKIKLSPEIVDPDDVEMLEDLIVAAVAEAGRTVDQTVEKEMAELTGGLPLPAGMQGML